MDQIEFLHVTSTYGAYILFLFITYFVFKYDDLEKPIHPFNRWLISLLLIAKYHIFAIINLIVYMNNTDDWRLQTPLLTGIFVLVIATWYYFIVATVRKTASIKALDSTNATNSTFKTAYK